MATIPGHTRPVKSAAFSSDGSKIVTASEDGTARVHTDMRFPTSRRQLAELFASGLHPRLGADSPLSILSQAFLRDICLSGKFDHFGPMQF